MRFPVSAARLLAGAAFIVSGSLLTACGGGSTGSVPAQNPQASSLGNSSQSEEGVLVTPYLRVMPDGTRLHIYPTQADREAYAASHRFTAATDSVQYHGGSVMHSSTTYAIYWQPTGTYMSPLYKPVIAKYFNDVGGSSAYNILTQYSDGAGKPQNASSLGGAWTDTSAYPRRFNDSAVRAEVSKAIKANHWPAGGYNSLFVVFTAQGARDSFAYCAYHGNFLSGANQVIYTIVPYQHDLGAQGCGTPTNVWPNDRDADQTIDTLWHEHAESVSDPVNAWYSDSTGNEIGDICQTTYGPRAADGSDVTLSNGGRFITQQLWSNSANSCRQTQ